jgi:hypothetical protein
MPRTCQHCLVPHSTNKGVHPRQSCGWRAPAMVLRISDPIQEQFLSREFCVKHRPMQAASLDHKHHECKRDSTNSRLLDVFGFQSSSPFPAQPVDHRLLARSPRHQWTGMFWTLPNKNKTKRLWLDLLTWPWGILGDIETTWVSSYENGRNSQFGWGPYLNVFISKARWLFMKRQQVNHFGITCVYLALAWYF